MTNNNLDMASLGYNNKLFLIDDLCAAAGAVEDAINRGADVINSSETWSLTGSPIDSAIVLRAISQGIIVVASAGNGPWETVTIPFINYPAAYKFGSIGKVIGVSGTILNNGSEMYIGCYNYCPGIDPVNDPRNSFIDFSAPGWNLTVIYGNDGLGQASGTSGSAPMVSALCALILSINDNLTPNTVYDILKNTADKIDQSNHSYNNGWNQYLGYGRINAYKALKYTIKYFGGTFDQDVTLPAGDTWNIQPGVTLNFNNNCSLIVKGTLNANGTSTNKITFQRNGSSGAWGTISFTGSGASNSILNNVVINNATEIQCLNGANISVQNSTFNNCTNGIYIYNSQSVISNNQMNGLVNNGIYGEASLMSPVILNNKIYKYGNQTGEGIYLYNSTLPYIAHNDIMGMSDGIYIGNNSHAYFSDANYNIFYPNNRCWGNGRGIVSGYGSLISCGSTSMNNCYNSFIMNTYNAYSYQSSMIYAQNNYWGNGQLNIYIDGTSILNTSSPLGTDPWPSELMATINSNQHNNLEKSISTFLTGPSKDNEMSDVITGLSLEKEGKTNEAIDQYKKMIKEGNNADFALVELAKVKKKYFKEDVPKCFDGLSINTKNLPLIANIKANADLQNGQFDASMKSFDEIIMNYPGDYQSINSRFGKLFAYLNYKNDLEKANQELLKIKDMKLQEDEWIKRMQVAEFFIEYSKNTNSSSYIATKTDSPLSLSTTGGIPSDYALLGNYPNPFNPNTTIKYSLPVRSDVEVHIYNLMGYEINFFEIKTQEAGYHSVKWNGQNMKNEQVSSGVYIYRLKAKSEDGKLFDKSAKMLFIK